MKKIPTLFQRDPDNPKRVLPIVTPGCEWVIAGEGVATRKYDGTCCQVTPDGQWWMRREVKPGKEPPPAFVLVETDPNTGKSVGWEPAEQSGFHKFLVEALEEAHVSGQILPPGTYELIGPKIQGNPEQVPLHELQAHADAQRFPLMDRPTFDKFAEWAAMTTWEGIVWHHPDGRMAKLKRRDFV